jgi:alpha-mannosidase
MRGMPEIPGGHPDEFIYEGLDGSTVFASHFRNTYDGAFDIYGKDAEPLQPRDMPYHQGYYSYEYFMELADHTGQEKIAHELIQNVRNNVHRYPSGVIPLMAGCDHCPPQAKIAETIKLANSMQDEIEFVMGDAEEYVREAQKNMTDPVVFNMELTGSFYQYILFGTLSTRSYIKRQHFGAEVMLVRYTEPLDAFASMLGHPGTRPQLDEAWKYVMRGLTYLIRPLMKTRRLSCRLYMASCTR